MASFEFDAFKVSIRSYKRVSGWAAHHIPMHRIAKARDVDHPHQHTDHRNHLCMQSNLLFRVLKSLKNTVCMF